MQNECLMKLRHIFAFFAGLFVVAIVLMSEEDLCKLGVVWGMYDQAHCQEALMERQQIRLINAMELDTLPESRPELE